MHPVLLEWPWGGTANSYGTMILLGMLLTMPAVWWDARDRGLAAGARASFVVDFYLVLIVGAFVGGRALYVITRADVFLAHPGQIFAVQSTGFVFFGSLIAAVGGLWWVARRYETTLGVTCDVLFTWAPLAHAFARGGCLLAGCCYGAPWDGPWALQFVEGSIAFLDPAIPHVDGHTVPLHPTQLYEMLGLLALFALLVTLRLRRGPESPWRQPSRYAIGYGILRTVVEMFRADPYRKFLLEITSPDLAGSLGLPTSHVFGLSTSQAIGLALVAAGIWGLRRTRRSQ